MSTHPVVLKFQYDMKPEFNWKYTQYSVFNESDTLLLVSGVHFGNMSTSGEIAVFSIEGIIRNIIQNNVNNQLKNS